MKYKYDSPLCEFLSHGGVGCLNWSEDKMNTMRLLERGKPVIAVVTGGRAGS
jgi:hypothetical protein